jgi:2-polyprenyl-3-methyl-5-hydroxy-6-metoxy-1,4-benzoquinol methylase
MKVDSHRKTPSFDSGRTNCAACGSDSTRHILEVDDTFSLVRCEQCGLIATAPSVLPADIGRYYPQSYYGEDNRRFNALLEGLIPYFRDRRARAIERFVPKGKVLDVGCGRGILPALMRERGWDAQGLEFSEAAAHHARNELGLPVFVGDFIESSYAEASFDAVVLWHVLEHVPDPVATLAKAHRLLRSGGLLVIAVPNVESLQARWTGRHWFHLDVPRHYHHFGLRVLIRMLRSNGFGILDVSHFSLEYNPYGWIQSILNKLGFRYNLLYDLLKNASARSVADPWRAEPVQMLLTLGALPVVAPMSFGLTLLEVLLRRGGTVEVYARCDK